MTEQEIGIAIFIAIVVFWGVGMLAPFVWLFWAIHQDDLRRENETRRRRKKSRRTSPARRTRTTRPTA